jgi:hypothetical protein
MLEATSSMPCHLVFQPVLGCQLPSTQGAIAYELSNVSKLKLRKSSQDVSLSYE